MADVVVVGAGGHGKVVISLLKKLPHRLLGYVDPMARGIVLGIQRLGDDGVLPSLLEHYPGCHAVIGVGRVEAASRLGYRLLARLEAMGFALPPVVSPEAVVNEEVVLGAGTVVCDGAIVNSGTTIGRGCILNTHCTVEHDCCLGENVHIAPAAVLSGGVSIGDHCMVGVGATVIQGVRVAADCMIGAGAVVVRDIEGHGVYAGNPARKLSSVNRKD